MVDWKRGEAEKQAKDIKRAKAQRFVSLHHHSTFSYLDGYGMPDAHADRAAELGMSALALTEHGNVSSHVRLEQAAKDAGIKPIFGCELYTGNVGEDATQRKNHLTVLAETEEGYRNLLRLVSRGWAEGFYYEPTVSGDMLRDHSEGLVVLSGCSGSLLATSLVGGKNVAPQDASYERARGVAERFKRNLNGSYYLEVQAFPELEKTRKINVGLAEMSESLGIPLVATLDAHYTKPSEGEMQAILHSVRPGKMRTIEQQLQSWGYDVPLTFPPGSSVDRVVYERLINTGLTKRQAQQAIYNAAEIAERCNVTLPKVENLRYPLPPDADSPEVLIKRWMNEGWQYRNINALPKTLDYAGRTYLERAKYELDLIIQKGFVDYFLVVADAVKFAKDNGIPVGPARGSAAASLVCYLLRITEVNPMLFPTLLFERFIDINRHDLPDIDLDFDDELRYMVKDYLSAKYGEDRVGNIGTFTKYKGRNSLTDVARVYQVPDAALETVKGLLIERSSGDLRANATIEDSIDMFPRVKEVFEKYPDLYKAMQLEGNVRGMSVHAAGLVVANGPLSDFCAVYTRTDDETGEVVQVVSLDKYDAEYLNVLKLDALGLKTMATIRIALEHIGMTLSELYAIPLDDAETLRGFQENDVEGVFQFDGRAMRSVNQGVVPDNFNEVADVNALARPGPLHSGATGEYIDIKHGRREAVHYHPIIDRITQHTQYQVVYQEQILQVVRELGGFSWEEAARIRKIISKKRGEQEFNRQRDKFVQGAAEHGMEADQANKVFSMLATAGAYAFNAAHCISYGMLAYWTMWLKRNHPSAFYVASLRKCGDDKDGRKRRMRLLQDTTKFNRNMEIRPLHLNKSDRTWTMEGNSIRPGFEQIKGIGEKTATRLLARREELGKFSSWDEVLEVHGIGPKTIELMQDFISNPDPFNLSLLADKIDEVRAALAEGVVDDSGVYMLPAPTHTASEVPYERTERDVPVVWLGVVRERNLKDLFELHHSRTGNVLDPQDVVRPDLNEWVVMTCEDDTDMCVVTIDRFKYNKFKEQAWSINPNEDLILVRGVKKAIQARRAIYVHDMWVLETVEDE